MSKSPSSSLRCLSFVMLLLGAGCLAEPPPAPTSTVDQALVPCPVLDPAVGPPRDTQFRCLPPDPCGDGVCSGSESCNSCPEDCGSCAPPSRNYTCGWALPNFSCDNGRTHGFVVAANMSSAVAACHAAEPSIYPDFCYVIDGDGGIPSDATQCAAAGGSWRSGNSCCNFYGSLSCP